MGTADLQAHLLQNAGHAVSDGRGRRQGEVHNAEGGVQPAAGLLGHQLAHAGHPESGLLHGLRHHVKGLALRRFQSSTHHAGAGDAHVDDLLRLSHAVESAGHKGVVLHGIAEHHQLGAAQAIPVRRGGSGILDDAAHQGHRVHIDARPGGPHVDGGTDQFCPGQSLRNGADQLFVRLCHALLHQGGVAADKVDAAGLGRPVQGQGKGHAVLRLAGPGHQGHGSDGNALVHDGDAELPLDVLAGLDQLLRIPGDLVVDLLTGPLRVRVTAAQQGDAHGDGADVQVLLVDHLNGR